MRSSIGRGAALVIGLAMILALAQACAPAPEPTAGAPTVSESTAAAAAVASDRADLIGNWEGRVEVAGQEIITRMAFEADGDGLKGTVDFPQQNVNGIPLDVATFADGKLHVEVLPAPRTAVFDGALAGDAIAGTFEQAGYKGAFELARVKAEAPPYAAEEVTFRNGDITLAGTLTLPEGQGPFPAVVLITGSGASTRDEELFGFKVFGVLADHLTWQGIAVLRYDDRGVGGSSGGSAGDTSETFAGDVAAAVAYLEGRPEIAAGKIGLLGHSEGGLIALIVATGGTAGLAVEPDDVAFVVLMAGPGLPGDKLIVEQGEAIAKAGGASAEEVARQKAMQEQIAAAALTGEGWDAVEAKLRQAYEEAAAALTDEQKQAVGDLDAWVQQMVDAQMAVSQSGWMKFFLSYDPAPALEKLRQPALALFGERDLQVPAESNRAAVEAALKRGGNADYEIVVIPEANHLFQLAETGSPTEYATLSPEFAPGFLSTVSDWILAHTR
ncbi:MAG: Alpha/beta hydrolase family protein [Chloroflexi bacterium ADurb.Bin325]|nr:MAG: Alpha/beta hydrolase family protein [Chloroflexi bacterium ADurb.Bin325]